LSDSVFVDEADSTCFESQSAREVTSLLARQERNLLNLLCRKMPYTVTPDWLTVVGLIGAVIVFVGYIATEIHPLFFWFASFGLVVQWFGDSLDGSLARYRRIERPKYGYFLDHSADAIAVFLIVTGLGLSPYIHLSAALFSLVGYLLMCIYVFLSNHVTGNFKLSFMALGPTELRMFIIFLNTVMYFYGGYGIVVGVYTISIYDLILCGTGVSLVLLYLTSVSRMTMCLREEAAPKSVLQPRHFGRTTESYSATSVRRMRS